MAWCSLGGLVAWAGLAQPLPAWGQAAGLRHEVRWHQGVPVHLLILPPGTRVRPHRGPRLLPVQAWARRPWWAVINAGYFNHADGGSVSWAWSEAGLLADPKRNARLMANPSLRPHLPRILEARCAWMAWPGAAGWRLGSPPGPGMARPLALAQAGPRLLPRLELEAEAFVRREPGGGVADPLGSQARHPRSALALGPGHGMTWVMAPPPGLSLLALADALRAWGYQEAMALDGGSSSALAWREGSRWRHAGGAAAVDTVLVAEGLPPSR